MVSLLFLLATIVAPFCAQNVFADQTLTTPAITSPNPAFVNGKQYTVKWTPIAGAISYKYESYHDPNGNNRRWQSSFNAPNVTFNNIADAVYYWRVQAVARDGSTGGWSDLWKVTVDSVSPKISNSTVTAQPDGSSVVIAGSITEPNLAGVSLKLDGVDVDSSAVSLTGNDFAAELRGLGIGSHTVEITATDKAGNKSAVRAHTFTVADTIDPVVTVAAPATVVEGEDVMITGTATDNHSAVGEVGIYVDGVQKGTAVVTDGQFSHNLGRLTPGTYQIVARGTDAAGNTGASTAASLTVMARPVVMPPIEVEPVTPPIEVETEIPTPTPAPNPTPQPASPNPSAAVRVVYLQPTASPAPAGDDAVAGDVDDDTGLIATGGSATDRGNADIRGATIIRETAPMIWGLAWYYWIMIILALTTIGSWVVLAVRTRRVEER